MYLKLRKKLSELDKRKRHKIRLWTLCIIWLVCFVSLWGMGIVGDWILRRGVPLLLPADLDNGFIISELVVEHLPVVPERGLRVSITPQRLKSMLRDINPLLYAIPAGIIRDGVVLCGYWVPEKASDFSIPLTINCTDKAGESPRVVFRYPFDELNELLQIEMEEDWRDEDEYFLGTYTRTQRIWFRSIDIKTEKPVAVSVESPIRLRIKVAGRLRYKVEDTLIAARITANVKELAGSIVLKPELHKSGIGFKYRCYVDKLSISVNKMAPWLERKLAGDLKDSIERSMNKSKRRKNFAKMRVPYWVPIDTCLDIELTETSPDKPGEKQDK